MIFITLGRIIVYFDKKYKKKEELFENLIKQFKLEYNPKCPNSLFPNFYHIEDQPQIRDEILDYLNKQKGITAYYRPPIK